jgi:hypothetical protein
MADQTRREIILSSSFISTMIAEGLIPDNCTRIVIEAAASRGAEIVTITYTCLADDRLVTAVKTLNTARPNTPPAG